MKKRTSHIYIYMYSCIYIHMCILYTAIYIADAKTLPLTTTTTTTPPNKTTTSTATTRESSALNSLNHARTTSNYIDHPIRPPNDTQLDVIDFDHKAARAHDMIQDLDCPVHALVSYRSPEDAKRKGVRELKDKLIDTAPIKWLKDGKPFFRENDNPFNVSPRADVVTLVEVGESDSGRYTCMLNFDRINMTKLFRYLKFNAAAYDLVVTESLPDIKPHITHPPADKIVERGADVTFSCEKPLTLSTQVTIWFKLNTLTNQTEFDRFTTFFNKTKTVENTSYLKDYQIYGETGDELIVRNVSDLDEGIYGCAVENNQGVDVRYSQLQLLDNYAKISFLRITPDNQTSIVVGTIIVTGAILFVLTVVLGCIYIFKVSMQNNKKVQQQTSSILPIEASSGKDVDEQPKHLSNYAGAFTFRVPPDADGFISGHFHENSRHLPTQSINSDALVKGQNPSISSNNSNNSDEASSWGKSMSSNGDNFRAFYAHTSHTTTTTVPLYDHPPSTGTIRHCGAMVQDACVINPTYGFLRLESDINDWAFPRRNLERLDKIGEGQFGEVWRYIARQKDGNGSLVAVKQLKNRAGLGDRERLELIAEIEIMKSVNDHPNVIKLLNYCADNYEPILLIMEYAENGKLQTYLRNCRASRKMYSYIGVDSSRPRITSKELIKFSYHIAKGMEYVASKGIVHRDLASRNILVSKDKVCKVADFGFARRVSDDCAYERTTANPVPVKWMAPEALVGNKFTTKSDVYSLGVLMWEIVTLGATPYEDLSSEEVLKKVSIGERLDRPVHCKDELYEIMALCWRQNPTERPTFKEIAQQLEKLLLSENDYIELDQYPEHAYYNIIPEEKQLVDI